jgi:predicted nuclease of restriction endonuclease-like RecB superfamily
MTLWAKADLKTIVRIIKLSRLMHTIRRLDNNEYQFTLSGPASALRSTRRYGVSMAKMIPSLLACRDWRMAANICIGSGKRQLLLTLSSDEGLTSPKLVMDEFDSEVEADLMNKWEASPVEGWILLRESELLVRHQKVFLPDFQLTHSSGKRIHLEIIGYWTPEYISAKLKTLQEFADEPILIIAQKDREQDMSILASSRLQSIIWYKTRVSLKDLAERLHGQSANSPP